LYCWMYARGVARIWSRAGAGRGIPRWRVIAFAGGMLAVAVALLSPLDALGDALLTAHMVQHLLLLVVAPPLLVLGTPITPTLVALPQQWRGTVTKTWYRSNAARRGWRWLNQPAVAWGLAAIVLWGWHVPFAYEAA